MTDTDPTKRQKSDQSRIDDSILSTAKPTPGLSPDDRIGQYTIKTLLGEGGFASVYLAEQTEPVRRRVALKINKLGMDTGQFLARFEAERQALALMDHPNVAMVFDAGETETGRSYFVMEYVPGEPITDYCDRYKLSTRDRLLLFEQVCAGVQHAHQKGIIHRDIKPSNVLVSVIDGMPLVKVIDFGVAKSIGLRLTEKTIFTEFGQIIGTPEYMSPEQAEMSVHEVDTRTDIYSLGVLLYELLVGALPFDPKSLRKAGFGEIQRIIREEEPQKPSTRLSTLGEQSDLIASKHHTNTRTLARELRGDLDWITMKALEKDRARRYSSASELKADIERYFHNEPVLAGPPSVTYRFSKFVRKNRLIASATAVLILAVLTGMAGIIIGAINASRQRDQAETARSVAELEQVKNAQIAGFLEEIFYSLSIGESQRDVTVAEILHNASQRIAEEPPANAEVEATVRRVIGTAYLNLGQYDRAAPHLRRAFSLLTLTRGTSNRETIKSLIPFADCLVLLGDLEEAQFQLQDTLRVLSALPVPDPELRFQLLRTLGMLFIAGEQGAEAESVCREAYTMATELYGDDAPESFAAMESLGHALSRNDKKAEYETLATDLWVRLESLPVEQRKHIQLEVESLEIQLRLHLGDGEIGLNNAIILQRGRRWTDQLSLKLAARFQAQYESLQQTLGETHSRTLCTLRGLAISLHSAQQYAEAETHWRAYLDAQPSPLEEGDEDVAAAMGYLAFGYAQRGEMAEAERLYRDVYAMLSARSFDNPELYIEPYLGYAHMLIGQSHFDEAEPILLECYRHVLALEEPDFRNTIVLMELVAMYEAMGDEDNAADYRRRLEESPPVDFD